jgi:predicted methyltransferase
MTEIESDDKLLRRIAEATRLREGPAGVETLLRAVKRLGPASLNRIAREARLPLPVASAVRRELEKAGLLVRGGGLGLSPSGNRFVEGQLGVRAKLDLNCPHCDGTGLALAVPGLLETLTAWLQTAPPVDVTLDQAPCTPATALRRVALMHRAGAVEGRRILILGDDDSVSLALALFDKSMLGGSLRHPITVVELDLARVAFLRARAQAESLPIEVISYDLRDPLPRAMQGVFDVAETDPPYTLEGARLFLLRARQALHDEGGTLGFLSYAQQSGLEQYALNQVLHETGFATTAMHPNFNMYQGAAILGSIGQMIELTGVGKPERPGERYDGALYSAEVRPRTRRYRCRSCNTVYTLGKDAPATIEALKGAGCRVCGGQMFQRLSGQTVAA